MVKVDALKFRTQMSDKSIPQSKSHLRRQFVKMKYPQKAKGIELLNKFEVLFRGENIVNNSF